MRMNTNPHQFRMISERNIARVKETTKHAIPVIFFKHIDVD